MTEPTPAASRVLVRAGERGPEHSSGHPYNPRAEIHGWPLSRMAGLGRIAVNLAWLPPGKESAIHHVHWREEEWLYVLEGRGVAEVGQAEHEVGPGDFLGFPPGTSHLLRSGPGERLLFLEGGELFGDVEVADFPRLRRRMVRLGGRLAVYPMDAEVPFMPGGNELPEALLGGERRAAEPRVLVRAGERGEPRTYRHPLNPAAEVRLEQLSRRAGLTRVAASVTRVPAGRQSYVKHVHLHDEEWMYVLSGRGIASIGEADVEIGAGDFLGFPARGPAHQVRAGADEDLAYVHGGDAWSPSTIEIVDFPDLGLRKTFVGTKESATFPLSAALPDRR
jgi:uncharacterized cupin superfamily protein